MEWSVLVAVFSAGVFIGCCAACALFGHPFWRWIKLCERLEYTDALCNMRWFSDELRAIREFMRDLSERNHAA